MTKLYTCLPNLFYSSNQIRKLLRYSYYTGGNTYWGQMHSDTLPWAHCWKWSIRFQVKTPKFVHWNIQGVPKNMGIQWRIRYRLLWISIVIPNFKCHNSIMSARVYFMNRIKDCKNVSIMSPQDEQWRRTSLLCLYTAICLFY